jgi:hypothetical protein
LNRPSALTGHAAVLTGSWEKKVRPHVGTSGLNQTAERRDVRFAIVRCRGETEQDRIACLTSITGFAEAHGATVEVIGEVCVFTYGAILEAPGSDASMLALVHDLCTNSRPASVVHGMRNCVVGSVGGEQRFALQTRIPGFGEFVSQLDDLAPGEARAV